MQTQFEVVLPKLDGVAPVLVDMGSWSQDMRDKLAAFALKELANNVCGAIKADDYKEADAFEAALRKAVEDRFNAIASGNWREGGGGKRVDPVEAECGATVVGLLVKAGARMADATARVMKDGWTKIVTAGATQAAVKAGHAPDSAEAIAAAEKAIKAIRSQAEKTVAARGAVDFDFAL